MGHQTVSSFSRTCVLVLVCLGALALAGRGPALSIPAEQGDTLQSIAHATGVRGGDLAEALGLEREVDKTKTLEELGVTRAQVDAALAHLTGRESAAKPEGQGRGEGGESKRPEAAGRIGGGAGRGEAEEGTGGGARHRGEGGDQGLRDARYAVYLGTVAIAMAYLLWLGILGRPAERKQWYPQWFYIAVLVVSLVGAGFLLEGKYVNPMGSVEKLLKASAGVFGPVLPKLAVLGFFLALAVVANKAICGWACPFGALQELLYTLPLFGSLKKRRLPFWLTNGVRIALFLVSLIVVYGALGYAKGTMVYHYMNPFNLFILEFTTRTVPFFLAAYVLTALFFYRPFCQFICPFGLISWLAERLSLTRVRIDPARCTHCNACARACPLAAAEGRLRGAAMPADCFSCMRCLRVCPADAIHYRPAWGSPSPGAPAGPCEQTGQTGTTAGQA